MPHDNLRKAGLVGKANSSTWYLDFCESWKTLDYKIMVKTLKAYPTVYSKLLTFIPDYYKGKPGVPIKAEYLYSLRYPDVENKCFICGNPTKYSHQNHTWQLYCSRKCVHLSDKVIAKRVETCIRKYGAENPSLVPEFKQKRTETIRERFGVDNAFQNEGIKTKIRISVRKKYGVDHATQSPDVQEKSRRTNLNTYGETHWTKTTEGRKNTAKMNTVEAQDKAKITNLFKYGSECPLSSLEIKEKVLKTNQEKYGMNNPGSLSKFRNYKEYTDRFGDLHKVIGYEHHALQYLNKLDQVTKIETRQTVLPKIQYMDNGTLRTYHPDILAYTTTGAYLIEVKSSYTITIDKDNLAKKCLAARLFCEQQGWTFWLVLVDDNLRVHGRSKISTATDLVNQFCEFAPKLLANHHPK